MHTKINVHYTQTQKCIRIIHTENIIYLHVFLENFYDSYVLNIFILYQ